jgi:hypothetical protein
MKPKLPLCGLVFAILVATASFARADTICAIYPDEAGSTLGPLLAVGATTGSLGVERTAGSGAVGSYEIQDSDGQVFTDYASVAAAGVTALTAVNAQQYRVYMLTAPDAGTTVRVCLFLNNPR